MVNRVTKLAVGVAVAALALTGCASGSVSGGDESPDPTQGSSELQRVTVGVFPSGTFGPLYLGIEKGIFAKHGLELELDSAQGGAALLPAVTTRSLDFAVGSPITPITAAARGLDVKIVSGYSMDDVAVPDDTAVVVVGPGSDIQNTLDLEGKTISVNALKAAGELGIREAVKLAGGNPDTINFVELGFPDVAAQLEAGTIDGGMMVPPFTQGVLELGGAVVSDFQRESGIGPMSLVVFASGALVNEDPELLKAFQDAIAEALEYAQANIDEVRAILPDALGMDETLAKTLPFEAYTSAINRDALGVYVRLLTEYGVVDEAPSLDALIASR